MNIIFLHYIKSQKKDHKLFFKDFKLKVMKKCSFKFTEEEEKEFTNFLEKFLR